VGLSPSIASALKSISPHFLAGVSAGGLTIALLTITYTMYKFCDIFPQSIYYPMWADVIPQHLMGTFTCLFRVVSTAGVTVFNWFLLKYCEDYPAAICMGASGLYVIAFVLLCTQVKEGEYPPPPPAAEGSPSERMIEYVRRFFRESFSHAFYWKYYLSLLCFNVGYVPFSTYLIFYGKDIKLDLSTYGRIMGYQSMVQMGVYLCLGPLVDRIHPLRAGMIGYVFLAITAICGFWLIRSTASFAVWVILIFAAIAVYQAATTSLGARLLPISHFAQFSSASALVFHFGQMILTPVLGLTTDHFGNAMIFPWLFGFSLAGMALLYLVYRDWKKLGGDEAYIPPLKDEAISAPRFEVVQGT
jgi:hypothetical protein